MLHQFYRNLNSYPYKEGCVLKKQAFAVLSITVTLSLLYACSSNSSGPNGSAQTGGTNTKEGPVDITVMTNFFAQTPAADNTEFEKKLEELTNSNLKIQWVSSNNYNDKLNVTLASGDMSDMIYIIDPFTNVFRNMTAQGALWDIGPYIKDYPNLSQYIDKVAWDATKMKDGKNYGVPRPRSVDGETFLIIRQDWLDNLGLKVPKTSDELYQVMKAFTENDPDKNGKNDTIGYGGYFNADSMGGMGAFDAMFTGASGDWKLQKDGKLAYAPLLPEQRQALEYTAKLYKEKLLPEDLAALKVSQARDLFKVGKAGIVSEKDGTMANYVNEQRKIDPKANVTSLTDINGYNPKGSGFSGLYAIPKKVPEAKMKQILKVMDAGMNKNVYELIKYGLEGVHYEVKNGEKIVNIDSKNRDAIGDYQQIFIGGPPDPDYSKVAFPKEIFGDMGDRFAKVQEERRKTAVPNYALGLYSETQQKINAELMKKSQDLKTKIIIGVEPLSAWDAYTAMLKSDPNMSKMIEEMNAAYQQRTAGK
jgi:putative aldouronate transport system substrate-binding protein